MLAHVNEHARFVKFLHQWSSDDSSGPLVNGFSLPRY
jgi:hypothetical protein